MASPQLSRRAAAVEADDIDASGTVDASKVPENGAHCKAENKDAINEKASQSGARCPLGFSGTLPAWHAPVPAGGGARCPFGFGAKPETTSAAASEEDIPLTQRLLKATELPQWMRDNEYIQTHYRPQLASAKLCIRSGFLWLTNETVNVWTHFVGCLLFLYLVFRLCARTGVWSALHLPSHLPHHVMQHLRHLPDLKHAARQSVDAAKSTMDASKLSALSVAGMDAARQSMDAAKLSALSALLRARGFAALRRDEARNALATLGATAADVARAARPLLAEHRWGTMPLLVTACFCTAASTAFHVFWVYSPRALRLLGKIDFVGIALLCAGHAVSGTFYAFFCKPEIAMRYYVGVAVLVVMANYAIFSPGFHKPKYRTYRAAVFSALGASSIIPLVHAGYVHGWHKDNFNMSLSWMCASGVAYALGAAIYASRYPECCRPGKHDRFWASHQLLHIAVIAGGCLHAYGCHTLMKYRLDQGCAASPFL